MIPDESPPPNLEAFRTYAEERGQIVRRDYHWGGEYTDEDGNPAFSEPGWETILCKEAKQDDGKIVVHCMFLDDLTLIRAWEKQWESLVELNDMGFQRTLEDHGYSRQRD